MNTSTNIGFSNNMGNRKLQAKKPNINHELFLLYFIFLLLFFFDSPAKFAFYMSLI